MDTSSHFEFQNAISRLEGALFGDGVRYCQPIKPQAPHDRYYQGFQREIQHKLRIIREYSCQEGKLRHGGLVHVLFHELLMVH